MNFSVIIFKAFIFSELIFAFLSRVTGLFMFSNLIYYDLIWVELDSGLFVLR
jgi:hypothetical protein